MVEMDKVSSFEMKDKFEDLGYKTITKCRVSIDKVIKMTLNQCSKRH